MMTNGPALAILNGDSTSSQPSSGERSLSTPSTELSSVQPSELSAAPPTRNGLTPSPPGVSEIDFEKETKVKYRRSSIVPDYRQSGFPTDSLPNGIGYVNGNSTPNGNGIITNGKAPSPSRSSFANGNTFASPRPSNLSARPRRSISPESTRRQTTMGFPTTGRTNGTVSPLTVRSVSPVGWRSGAVSPIAARSSSPVGTYRNSPLSNGNAGTPGTRTSAQAQALAAHKLAARHTMSGLTLNTQMTVPAAQPRMPRPQTSGSNDSEEVMDEVISLSPAVRAPVLRFKRSSTLGSQIATPYPESSSMTLDTVMEDGSASGGGGKYTGQNVNAEDLVAVNLENAFDLL